MTTGDESGVLGCGNVGAALVAAGRGAAATTIAARTGVRLEVARVAVRSRCRRSAPSSSPTACSPPTPPRSSTDPDDRRGRRGDRRHRAGPRADPRRRSRPASRWSPPTRSCSPTTAPSCSRRPTAAGVDLLFEAAVAGGIPLIRPLRESLVGERISRVMGIVNGTTNFILTRMTEEGATYADALAEAQSLGYAERDPTADVEGFDAGAKAAILASHRLRRQGRRRRRLPRGHLAASPPTDIAFAAPARLRHQAARRSPSGSTTAPSAVRVHPAMVPADAPAGRGARQLQRRVRRGRRRRRPHVLRPRRRRRSRPRRRVLGDLDRRRRQPAQGHPRRRSARSAGRRIRPIDELAVAATT